MFDEMFNNPFPLLINAYGITLMVGVPLIFVVYDKTKSKVMTGVSFLMMLGFMFSWYIAETVCLIIEG